jgi:hypothetical protein
MFVWVHCIIHILETTPRPNVVRVLFPKHVFQSEYSSLQNIDGHITRKIYQGGLHNDICRGEGDNSAFFSLEISPLNPLRSAPGCFAIPFRWGGKGFV